MFISDELKLLIEFSPHWVIKQPSIHETLAQCCYNVGTPSLTAAQHQNNIGSMSRVCWDVKACSSFEPGV